MAIEERKTLTDEDIATASVRQPSRPSIRGGVVARTDADQGDVDGGDADSGDRTDATDRADRADSTDRGDATDSTDRGESGSR
jgi:hypothetical protein